ncbi:MAG TPA: hypothetical protein VFR75_11570 [Solirubrobacterales bacterium]|nr:hypothetical protein [Solirubrobacterales bacterium]
MRGMRRAPYLLLLVLVAALVASGCGDNSDAEEKTLTKKQFVKLTEAFCDKEYRAEERDMEAYAEKHLLLFGGGEPWEQEVLNEIVFEYVEDKIAYFKSLPAPEGDEKEVRAMITAFEEGLEKSEQNPAGLAEPRPFAKKKPPSDFWDASYETTSDYGPWLCGQP